MATFQRTFSSGSCIHLRRRASVASGYERTLVGPEELENVRRLLPEARTTRGGKRHRDVPPNVLVGVLHPLAEPCEGGIRVGTNELVPYRERAEALAHVVLMIAERGLDQIEQRLRPLWRPRSCRVLRRDDDGAPKAAIGAAHPLAE